MLLTSRVTRVLNCVMVFTAYSVHIGFKLERKLKQRHVHKTVHVLQGDK